MQEIASHFVHKNSIDVHQEFKAQFIVFRIETQEYGIPITSVKEIKGWSPTTTLPHSPPYMRGVVNLRGIIVPILDLRSRFGMGLTEVSPTHVVMIIHLENRTVGLLVDAVSDILTVNPQDIKPVPELSKDTENSVVQGLVQMDKRMVALLDLNQVFDASVVLTNACILGGEENLSEEEIPVS